jgi:hypothetical protein
MKRYDAELLNIASDNRRECTEYDIMLIGKHATHFFKVSKSNSQQQDMRAIYKKLQEFTELQEELGLND